MSNAFRIKQRSGGRDRERGREKTGIKQGGRDGRNNCNKVKHGGDECTESEGIQWKEGERQGKIEGD